MSNLHLGYFTSFLMKDKSGRLSEILRHQAALLEHIVTDQRFYSEYFRVAFYGNFPVAIRNKQFIVSLSVVYNVKPQS